MGKIENYLREKLDGFKKIEDFQKHFDKMAKYILCNVAIVIGDSNILGFIIKLVIYFLNSFNEIILLFTKNPASLTLKPLYK